MPHFPKPYFRRNRGLWYVQIAGHQHNLGPDEKAAFDRYHELMRQQPREADLTLAIGVIDAFLTHAKENAAERTFEWYQRHLQAFASSFPPMLAVSQLKKHHLTACLQKRKSLNSTTQNGLCRAVVRAFRWAESQDIIQRSPFRGVEKPKHRSRTVVIPEADYRFMLGHFSDNIGLLLEAAWHTAARPQELCALEARHVDLKNARWVFPAEESKGKRFPRVVYLDDRALEITKLLAGRHPSGHLFRNADGQPWNRHSVACVFGRLQVDLGLKKMKELGVTLEKPPRFKQDAHETAAALEAARAVQRKALYERRKALYKLARTHATKYSLYHFRHTWCQRALKAGVDPLTVAILMGHHDPSTIAKVYQHLALDPDFLRRAITKATATTSATDAA